jgi:hypothetical protein
VGQTTPFDSNNALAQVKYAIKGLMNLDYEDDEDDVIYAANKLNAVLRMVHDNHLTWNDEIIREFVLSQHDPLRHIAVKSDSVRHTVRNIQHDIIVKFS